MGTLLVGGVLAAFVALLVVRIIRDHRKGNSSCDGSCSHCKSCHK